MYVTAHIHVCGGQRSILFSETIFFVDLELVDQLGWMACEFPGSIQPSLPALRLQACTTMPMFCFVISRQDFSM